MFRNNPPKDVLKEMRSEVSENLKIATEFICQSITSKNKLLTQAYLTKPDEKVLKQIYIIYAISQNLTEENRVDNNNLIDSLSSKNISVYELVDNYYQMLFTAVGNKNQPFDLSKTNLELNKYGLKDETEKGILVLEVMRSCGSDIWGYMNIVKPANTKKALEEIKKFPKINGQAYYQFRDLYFPDFDMKITTDKDIESYKEFYINKFYEVLLSHLICLRNEGGNEKEKMDLMLGSILKDKGLYKYTRYKEVLEKMFEVQNK